MKDPMERVRELERHCEAFEQAIAEIRAATWEVHMTLPKLKHRIAKIVIALPDRQKWGESK